MKKAFVAVTVVSLSLCLIAVAPAHAQQAQSSAAQQAASAHAQPAAPPQQPATPQASDAAPEPDPSGFKVFWREGLRAETNDGRFQFRLGGRIQYDWVLWGDDAKVAGAVSGPIVDGTEFRRARIFVQGYMYERFEYKLQLDFAGGDVALKDVYFGVMHPTFGFRMGHMKEPFSLEELTSSKYITFVERALPSVFDSERNSGFMLHGDIVGGNLSYGVGVFHETGDNGVGVLVSRYNFTGRLAGALRNTDDGRSVVHVGGSATFQNDDGTPRVFAQRPEIHLAPRFISSGVVPTDSAAVLGLEALVIEGPFSAQAEWKAAPIRSEEQGNPTFFGWYAFGSYFLTGENRHYDGALIERLHPYRNFLENGGLGAWEIAVRYSMLDLDAGVDKGESLVTGTRLDNITLGVNWYWNPMTLMRFNVIRADIRDVGDVWAFLWRGQVEF